LRELGGRVGREVGTITREIGRVGNEVGMVRREVGRVEDM
jgi:hypothetical protein